MPYDFSLRNRDKLYQELEGLDHVWITANRVAVKNADGVYVKEYCGTGSDFPWLDHVAANCEAMLMAFCDFQQHGKRAENEILSFACAHTQADISSGSPLNTKGAPKTNVLCSASDNIEIECNDHVRFFLECQQRRVIPLFRISSNRYLCCLKK